MRAVVFRAVVLRVVERVAPLRDFVDFLAVVLFVPFFAVVFLAVDFLAVPVRALVDRLVLFDFEAVLRLVDFFAVAFFLAVPDFAFVDLVALDFVVDRLAVDLEAPDFLAAPLRDLVDFFAVDRVFPAEDFADRFAVDFVAISIGSCRNYAGHPGLRR